MSESRRILIAGNWKMNCSRSEAVQLASAVIASSDYAEKAELLICVPTIHLADVGKLVADSHVKLGAQNAHWQDSGAYTGEVSTNMLLDYQVEYSLELTFFVLFFFFRKYFIKVLFFEEDNF